jgi:alpha-tubulin suppressor-like RCC1 family protein
VTKTSSNLGKPFSGRWPGRILVLAVLLLSILGCRGQKTGKTIPKYIVGMGEYQCFLIHTSTGKLYGISSNLRLLGAGDKTGEPGLPIEVAIPGPVRAVASGLHNSVAADHNGDVWAWGSNEGGQAGNGSTDNPTDGYPHRIIRDSIGNPFTQVIQLACWANHSSEGCIALKSDGTVWIWGNTGGGFRGNGQYGQLNARPVQIFLPGGRKIIKIVAAEIALALASDGSVWTWGGDHREFLLGTAKVDYRSPGRVILPQPAKDIAGGSYISYVLGVNGKLYGWGYAAAYMGVGTGGYEANTPIALPRDLDRDLKLPHPVVSVSTNSVSTHVILSDSTLWGWGDNATGCVGNGQELNFADQASPYAWDFGPSKLLVQKPVHVAPMVHNFTKVFGGSAYVFYSYAETITGQLYSWGRNKGAVLGNGIVGASSEIMATYPSSWDIPTVTAVDPLALTASFLSTSPYCIVHPDGSPCNSYRIPKNISPVANAGENLEAFLAAHDVILNGSSSHDDDGRIVYFEWSKISGPSGSKITSPGSAVTALTGLMKGTYIFLLKVIDNGWARDSAKIQIKIF